METFAKLFARFLIFVCHCFDRIVIQGYLPLLTRPEHIVHFFRDVHGQYPITCLLREILRDEFSDWRMLETKVHRRLKLATMTDFGSSLMRR